MGFNLGFKGLNKWNVPETRPRHA